MQVRPKLHFLCLCYCSKHVLHHVNPGLRDIRTNSSGHVNSQCVPCFVVCRCLALFAAGLSTQFKYCFAWTLAEAGYLFAGLSFEGWDAPPAGKDGQLRPKW